MFITLTKNFRENTIRVLFLAGLIFSWPMASHAGAIHDAAKDGDIAALTALLDGGANPNARDESGLTPLYLATFLGHADTITILLKAGADPNARDESGWTSLHIAAIGSDADIIAALLDGGADPNARDESGWTPLHNAAGNGHADAIAALLDAGADVKATNKNGKTAFDLIKEYNSLYKTPIWRRLNDAQYK
jgi:ankyrin repeat protein